MKYFVLLILSTLGLSAHAGTECKFADVREAKKMVLLVLDQTSPYKILATEQMNSIDKITNQTLSSMLVRQSDMWAMINLQLSDCGLKISKKNYSGIYTAGNVLDLVVAKASGKSQVTYKTTVTVY